MPRRLLLIALLLAACSKDSEPGAAPVVVPDPTAAKPIKVAPGEKLVFRYFPKNGGAKTASTIEKVPADARERVLVIPESGEIPAGVAYLADLRTPGADGSFPYRVITQAELDTEVSAARTVAGAVADPVAGPKATVALSAPPPSQARQAQAKTGDNEVIMFSTSWCGVCANARRWFRNKGIAIVEKDIEEDAAAEADLQKRAAQVGVDRSRLTGVPIIWVNGQLFPGFDPGKISAALHG